MSSIYVDNYIIGYDYINYNTKEASDLGLLKIFQEIACRHASILGYGLNDIPNTHLTWLVLNWKFKIFKRPIYGQKIIIRTWPRKALKSIYYRDFEISSEDGEKLCIVTSKWVLINTDTHSMVLENEDVNKKFTQTPINVFDGEIKKIHTPENFENSLEYKILRRDIDTNGHVNNTIYLSLAYECLPEHIYNNLDYNLIEIMYKNECTIDDTILIKYSKIDNGFIVVISNKYRNDIHCIIKYNKV